MVLQFLAPVLLALTFVMLAAYAGALRALDVYFNPSEDSVLFGDDSEPPRSPDRIELIRSGFQMDDPDDGSLLSICFAVPQSDVAGQMKPENEVTQGECCCPDWFERRDERTRSGDTRRYEVALARAGE